MKQNIKIIENFSRTGLDNYDIYYEDSVIGKVELSRNGDTLDISGFSIDLKYRGQGLGKAALKEIEVFAKKKNLHKLYLNVHKDNLAAKSLYFSFGFNFINLDNYCPNIMNMNKILN